MSYGLLWIETLAFALLWLIASLAQAGRIRSTLRYALAAVLALIPPTAIFGSLAALSTYVRLERHLHLPGWGYILALAIAWVVGAAVVLILASRREAGLPRAAATWPRGRSSFAFFIAAAVWLMTVWNMDLVARTQLNAVRAEAGAVLLSVSPPVADDSRNAAILYEKAFARLQADAELRTGDIGRLIFEEKPDLADPAISQFLDRHAPTVALIHRAVQLPDCYFYHNYARPDIAVLLPELANFRECGAILKLHARRELARGHVDAAIDDLNTHFRMAQQSARSPFLIAALLSMGVDAQAVQCLSDVLPAASKPEQLARINLDDPDRIPRTMQRALHTEEAFAMAIMCDVATGHLSISDLSGSPRRSEPFMPAAGEALFRIFLFGDDVASYQGLIRQYQEASIKPYYQAAPRLQQIAAQLDQHPTGLLTSTLLPSLGLALNRAAQAQASLESAQCGVAIARYRAKEGRLPSRLEELVPAYLPEVPVDPYDGKPLRLKTTEQEVIVYSVGPDGKDDGGAEYSKDHSKPAGDITFRLKR